MRATVPARLLLYAMGCLVVAACPGFRSSQAS
jgi:hypothetical protein